MSSGVDGWGSLAGSGDLESRSAVKKSLADQRWSMSRYSSAFAAELDGASGMGWDGMVGWLSHGGAMPVADARYAASISRYDGLVLERATPT